MHGARSKRTGAFFLLQTPCFGSWQYEQSAPVTVRDRLFEMHHDPMNLFPSSFSSSPRLLVLTRPPPPRLPVLTRPPPPSPSHRSPSSSLPEDHTVENIHSERLLPGAVTILSPSCSRYLEDSRRQLACAHLLELLLHHHPRRFPPLLLLPSPPTSRPDKETKWSPPAHDHQISLLRRTRGSRLVLFVESPP